MYKKYRIATSLVLIMSSFVFAQDVTNKINLRLNIVDRVAFSVYCGLSHVFESASDRVKCSADNWKAVTPRVVPVKPIVITPQTAPVQPVVINTATSTPDVKVVSTVITEQNPVLLELQKKIAENTSAISKLEDKTNALEKRAAGQTIIKYVSGGSRGVQGPKGTDGVTTVVYATPTAMMFNNLSGSILFGEGNDSLAKNNISIGRGILNTVDNSLQIGPSDVAKITLVAGTSSSDMLLSVPGRIVATSFCIADMCIDANVISKVVNTFK